MQSFAIVGQIENARDKAQTEAKNLNAKIYFENISKISEAREFIKNTSLSYTNPVIYFLEKFDDASLEAQNALLKTIEEPNNNLYIYLHAQNIDKLLPTIQSRISVIFTESESKLESKTEFFNKTEAEMLEEIYSIKKREEAVDFINNLLNGIDINSKHIKYLNNLEQTRVALSYNGNATIQLINLVVNLNN